MNSVRVNLNKVFVDVYDFGDIKLHCYQTNDAMNDESYILENDKNVLLLEFPAFYDNLEEFVFVYFFGQTTDLKSKVKLVDIRRVKYNYHNYLFIPMVLYCLKKLYHAIMADTSIMDEALLTDEHMKSHTMRG